MKIPGLLVRPGRHIGVVPIRCGPCNLTRVITLKEVSWSHSFLVPLCSRRPPYIRAASPSYLHHHLTALTLTHSLTHPHVPYSLRRYQPIPTIPTEINMILTSTVKLTPRSPRTPRAPQTPRTLTRQLSAHGYRLREQLEGGNYGVIHIGMNKITREAVIIKELNAANPNRLFAIREADCMAALSHPHIVKLHDRIELEERLFLAMQLARGGDLHDHITLSAEGMLPVLEAKRIFVQLVLALDHMHKKHLVHLYVSSPSILSNLYILHRLTRARSLGLFRDLKPDNIFLDSNLNVLLGDFGLADRFKPKSRSLEARGGTLHYSAPESFIGTLVEGPELDVWSAGVVLYVMMRGRYPFWGETEGETAKAIMFTEPCWPEWFPSEAVDLLKRMLLKNPRQRISLSKIKRHPFIQREYRHCKRTAMVDDSE